MAKTVLNGYAVRGAVSLIVAGIAGGWWVLWNDHDAIVGMKRGDQEVMRRLERIEDKVDRLLEAHLKG